MHGVTLLTLTVVLCCDGVCYAVVVSYVLCVFVVAQDNVFIPRKQTLSYLGVMEC